VLTTTPTQTASVAAVDASSGLNVPIMGNNPTFTPQLLKTAAGAALQQNFFLAASWQPYSADGPAATKVRNAYEKKFPSEVPNGGVDWGYGAAQAYAEVLKKACTNKDLTRDGVQTAFRQTTAVNTDGLFPVLDYSHPGDPATREANIAKADPKAKGGLTVVQDLAASDMAKSYVAPAHAGG